MPPFDSTPLSRLNCEYAFYYHRQGVEPVFLANQTRFLSASLIKVPILLAWLELERAGQVSRDEMCDLDAEPQVLGSGFSWQMRQRILPYQDVLLMMIATSDNLCTNLVIRRAGLERLNRIMRETLDLPGAELQRKLFDYDARARGLDNWITAEDCIRLYDRIAALPTRDRAWVEAMLSHCQDNALLARSIPRDTLVFYHKTGSITGVLHDWGYTENSRMFLLTHGVTDEPAAFTVFAALGAQLA